MTITEQIKQKALEVGFDLVGITDASPIDGSHIAHFRDWLSHGRAAGMSYLHKNFEKRINPAELLNGARSVICVGLNYRPAKEDDFIKEISISTGRVANYARYEDYHVFCNKLIRRLADFILTLTDDKVEFKFCVDSVPVAERALAERAGLGFIGKNHMLINSEMGLQIFLAEIVTTLELEPDRPGLNGCPDCDRCIRACPTGALDYKGGFDARKCLSYLTIEHKGDISAEIGSKIGDRLFGCDNCVAACPYNNPAPQCVNKEFKYYSERAWIDLQEIAAMTAVEFDSKFSDSPIHRAGLAKLRQNAMICIKNKLNASDMK